MQLMRRELENCVAMRRCHGENKVGLCGNPSRQLSRGEVGYFATKSFQYLRGSTMNGMPNDCSRAGARGSEIFDPLARGKGRGKAFRRRGTADISGANE